MRPTLLTTKHAAMARVFKVNLVNHTIYICQVVGFLEQTSKSFEVLERPFFKNFKKNFKLHKSFDEYSLTPLCINCNFR